MTDLSSFYNSLFAIEFAVLSIFVGGVFLILQIVYENRLHQFLIGISRVTLAIIICFPLLALLITGLAALLSSLMHHDYIPGVNFGLRVIIKNPWFALAALFLCVSSLIIVIWLTLKELLAFRPIGLIDRTVKRVDPIQIRDYLITTFGMQEPFYVDLIIDGIVDGKESADKEKKQVLYQKSMERYREIVREGGSNIDPCAPIGELAIQAIRNRDSIVFGRALGGFLEIMAKNFHLEEADTDSFWNPNDRLDENLITYALRWNDAFVEECRREDNSSFMSLSYDFSRKVCLHAFESGNGRGVREIVNYWKLQCDQTMTLHPRTSIQLIGFLGKLGKRAILEEHEISLSKEVLDEVCKSLGWLAERLLKTVGIEEQPLMYDTDYKTVYGELYNVIFTLEWDLREKTPTAYPLIFFDTIKVLFNSLVSEIQRNQSERVRRRVTEQIFDCMYAYSSFASAAIQQHNNDGAALAVLRLMECLDELRKHSDNALLLKSSHDAVGLIVGVLFDAAGTNLSSRFLGNIENYLFGSLKNLPSDFAGTIYSEVKESYFKAGAKRDHEAAWVALRKLGVSRGTNFGFMFDAKTGEPYSDDDPRRE